MPKMLVAEHRSGLLPLACLLLMTGALRAAEPVRSTATHVSVLQVLFPGLAVAPLPGRRIDKSWHTKGDRHPLAFPDALAREPMYAVTGQYIDDAERCASEDMENETFSQQREVRLRLYRWPVQGNAGEYRAAVVQYAFTGATPAFSCLSIARVVLLEHGPQGWSVRDSRLLETMHHSRLQDVSMLDLTGDGVDELLVDSHTGGAGTVMSNVLVFGVVEGQLHLLVDVPSRLQSGLEGMEQFTQVLDVAETVQQRGERFCFAKTVHAENDKWLDKPRQSRECYVKGTGVEPDRSVAQ